MKKYKTYAMIMSSLGIMLLVVGVSYSFFNYTRTGAANTIRVGRIAFVSRQTETINLTNLFPIDPTETGIMDDDTKVGTLEIEIEGDTDYADGVEYLISTTNSSVHTSTGKIVPISLSVTVTDLGTPSDNYFMARNSKNATIYKRLSGGSVVGDQQLLVGYIKPNTTSGTADGVDGKITIKAYFDENKIAISDTYDGTEADNMGTTNNWVNGRTVLTTEEWNSLSTNGISFQVRIEANEGIWVDEPIYNTLRTNAVMDNINSTYVNNTTPGIDFSNISSDTNGKGLYIRSGTENDAYPIIYYRGNVDNNVYFANKCWQIVRTTETGGTKLIYNGENTGTESTPACEPATGDDRQITLNIDGIDTNTFAYAGKNLINSPAYLGYMYGTVYTLTNNSYTDGAYFGNGFTYDKTNNLYSLTNAQIGIDKYHHYTCNLTTENGTCANIRYYFTYYTQDGKNYYQYFTLSNGKSIYDAVDEMQENRYNSSAKKYVDQWYEENISNTEYENEIEDTVYCNDRSIYQLGGLNPNGGETAANVNATVIYLANNRALESFNPITFCPKINDSFTVSTKFGNGKLNYPIALINLDEMMLAGGKMITDNTSYYLYTDKHSNAMTPFNFHRKGVSSNISYVKFSSPYNGSLSSSNTGDDSIGLRPVISLKQASSISSGLGTGASPYIIK